MDIFTIEKIKETATYQELVSKKQTAKCDFLIIKAIRERITHAVQVQRNTGSIPNTVSGIYLSVVKDIIAMQEPDRSIGMTAEDYE